MRRRRTEGGSCSAHRGLSSQQFKAVEEDMRVASAKMEELIADEAKIQRRILRDMAHYALTRIQEEYKEGSQRDPVATAKLYRQRIERKTIYDFAGQASRPEHIAASKASSNEYNRLWQESQNVEVALQPLYRSVWGVFAVESRKRFPSDELAQMNWVLDQVRGKSLVELATKIEWAHAAARAALPGKEICLADTTRHQRQRGQGQKCPVAHCLHRGSPQAQTRSFIVSAQRSRAGRGECPL